MVSSGLIAIFMYSWSKYGLLEVGGNFTTSTCHRITPIACLGEHHHLLTLHGPMVYCCLCDKSNGVQVDPFPEDDVVCHLVGLHFALHLNVEDLEVLASCG